MRRVPLCKLVIFIFISLTAFMVYYTLSNNNDQPERTNNNRSKDTPSLEGYKLNEGYSKRYYFVYYLLIKIFSLNYSMFFSVSWY